MLPIGFKPMLAINYDDVKVQPQNLYMSEKVFRLQNVINESVK